MRFVSIFIVLIALGVSILPAQPMAHSIPKTLHSKWLQSPANSDPLLVERDILSSEETMPSGLPRIIGGIDAAPGAWPWMAALVSDGQPAFEGFFCGGSLIAPQWVVTAAHCVLNTAASQIDVVLGIRDLIRDQGQRVDVMQIISHPAYNPNRDDNDIALLKLSQAVTQQTVSVYSGNDSLTGQNATVIGWGTTSPSGTRIPNILQQVSLPVVSNATCNQSYGGGITQQMLCAGFAQGGKDACQGDSGGPLVISNANRWELAGIVSWGDGCALPNAYGVYARISALRSFVNQYVQVSGNPTPQAPGGQSGSNNPPGPATLLSPSGVVALNQPTFRWQALSGATGYYIYIEGPGSYKFEQTYDAAPLTAGATSALTLPTVLSPGDYIWLVHGYNENGFGPWVQPMSFTVTAQGGNNGPTPQAPETENGSGAPAPAVLIAPSGNIGADSPTFSWYALDGVTHYYIYIEGPGYQFERIYQAGPLTSGGTGRLTLPATLPQGDYIWLVHGYNQNGFGPWVQPLSFTVTAQGGNNGPTPQAPETENGSGAPAPAVLIAPSGNIGANSPTFSWYALAGATHYYIYVEGPGYLFERIYEAQPLTLGDTCSLTLPDTLGSGNYIWLVHGYNENGFGPWIPPAMFEL